MTLKVTVELVPAGNAGKKRTLCTMEISNMTELADLSDYHVIATGERTSDKREGTVRGHERRKLGRLTIRA